MSQLPNLANNACTWGEITERQADRLVECGHHVNLLQIACDASESEDLAPAYVIVDKESGIRHGNPIIIPADEFDGDLGKAYAKAVRNFKIVESYLGIVCNNETEIIAAGDTIEVTANYFSCKGKKFKVLRVHETDKDRNLSIYVKSDAGREMLFSSAEILLIRKSIND